MERAPTLCNLCILFSLSHGHTRCGSILILLGAPKIAFRSQRATANFRWLLIPATINRHHHHPEHPPRDARQLLYGQRGGWWFRASGLPNTTGVAVRSVYRLLRWVTSCIWSNRDRSTIKGWLWWERGLLNTCHLPRVPVEEETRSANSNTISILWRRQTRGSRLINTSSPYRSWLVESKGWLIGSRGCIS